VIVVFTQEFAKMSDKERCIVKAHKILEYLDTWENLNELSLSDLFLLQRYLGYIIEEKIQER
jgi:hypothetical protein